MHRNNFIVKISLSFRSQKVLGLWNIYLFLFLRLKYLEAPIQQNNIFADNLENCFCTCQGTEIPLLINCNDGFKLTLDKDIIYMQNYRYYVFISNLKKNHKILKKKTSYVIQYDHSWSSQLIKYFQKVNFTTFFFLSNFTSISDCYFKILTRVSKSFKLLISDYNL